MLRVRPINVSHKSKDNQSGLTNWTSLRRLTRICRSIIEYPSSARTISLSNPRSVKGSSTTHGSSAYVPIFRTVSFSETIQSGG